MSSAPRGAALATDSEAAEGVKLCAYCTCAEKNLIRCLRRIYDLASLMFKVVHLI